jgi:hypothetical protein
VGLHPGRRLLPAFLLLVGLAGVTLGGALGVHGADPPGGQASKRLYAPNVARDDPPTPTPTPTPTPEPWPGPDFEPPPFVGAVSSISLASAGIASWMPIEERDTTVRDGREVFEDPSAPGSIAWYPRFGRPGFRSGNTVFAAHVNYFRYGNGPFAGLAGATPGDSLYVTMANGAVYTYTVNSITLVAESSLDQAGMNAVVFPFLPRDRERVTLISCGGTFVPRPGGGGSYLGRVILVAERIIE